MEQAQALLSDDRTQLQCVGDWTMAGIATVEGQLAHLLRDEKLQSIDGRKIAQMDSAGALWLVELMSRFKTTLKLSGFSDEQKSLLKLIQQEVPELHRGPHVIPPLNVFAMVGKNTVQKGHEALRFLAFVGKTAAALARGCLQPRRIQWATTWGLIDSVGYQALPIIALMSFLIGMVLAYQMGIQLKTYGANIYIVDFTGVAIFREFAPLITAIIMAGRSATSFTAQIGTMRVNEEIDALETMGDPPFERLVLPKIIALVIALPLLTVWADIFGALGSMIVSHSLLKIGYDAFIARFSHAVSLTQYILGIVKTPVFALIIAVVGTFQGFQVVGSTDSVGRKTTKAAVQALFLIIIADAAFSILFAWLNL